jgi:hypothetical protein
MLLRPGETAPDLDPNATETPHMYPRWIGNSWKVRARSEVELPASWKILLDRSTVVTAMSAHRALRGR